MKAFNFDERNSGGRRQIELHMRQHVVNILKAKPTAYCKSYSQQQLRIRENLSRSRRNSNYNATEHIRNLLNLQKKIDRINTGQAVTERKKNHFDHIIYPSLFFRKKDDPGFYTSETLSLLRPSMTSSLQRAKSVYEREITSCKPTKRHMRTPRSMNSARNSCGSLNGFQTVFVLTKARTPIGEPVKIRLQSASQKNDSYKRMYETYFDPANGKKRITEEILDPYLKFKRLLVEKIIEARIYRKQDLDDFYAQAVRMNPIMDRRRLKAIWSEIMFELNA